MDLSVSTQIAKKLNNDNANLEDRDNLQFGFYDNITNTLWFNGKGEFTVNNIQLRSTDPSNIYDPIFYDIWTKNRDIITLLAFCYDKESVRMTSNEVYKNTIKTQCDRIIRNDTITGQKARKCNINSFVYTKFLDIPGSEKVNVQVVFHTKYPTELGLQSLAKKEFYYAIYYFLKIHERPANMSESTKQKLDEKSDEEYIKGKIEISKCYEQAAYQGNYGNCYALSVLNMIRLNSNFKQLIDERKQYVSKPSVPTQWYLGYTDSNNMDCPIGIRYKGKNGKIYVRPALPHEHKLGDGGYPEYQILAPIMIDMNFRLWNKSSDALEHMTKNDYRVYKTGETEWGNVTNVDEYTYTSDSDKDLIIYFDNMNNNVSTEDIRKEFQDLILLGALFFSEGKSGNHDNHVKAAYYCNTIKEYRIHEQHGIDFAYPWTLLRKNTVKSLLKKYSYEYPGRPIINANISPIFLLPKEHVTKRFVSKLQNFRM